MEGAEKISIVQLSVDGRKGKLIFFMVVLVVLLKVCHNDDIDDTLEIGMA